MFLIAYTSGYKLDVNARKASLSAEHITVFTQKFTAEFSQFDKVIQMNF